MRTIQSIAENLSMPQMNYVSSGYTLTERNQLKISGDPQAHRNANARAHT